MATRSKSKYSPVQSLLREALDAVEETFWIKNEEFKLATHADVVEQHFKSVVDGGNVVNIAYACSVGLLSLARSVVHRTPLSGYDIARDEEPQLRQAGIALADAIVRSAAFRYSYMLSDVDHEGVVIIAWNDAAERTREDVVTTFQAALASPLATARRAWVVRVKYAGASAAVPLWFATRAQAQEFRQQLVANGAQDDDVLVRDAYELVEDLAVDWDFELPELLATCQVELTNEWSGATA